MSNNLSFLQDNIVPLTNKQKRKLKRVNTGLRVKEVEPMTKTQERVFNSYYSGKNIMCHGVAGTGKTFIALYLATQEVLSNYNDTRSLHIIRSVVPTRDMGFLPGNQREKSKVYEAPYYAIFTELFQRGDAYEILKGREQVHFTTTSFIRGLTINDAVVIVDECQNMTYHELDSIITRLGDNCKIVFCGDFRQSDFRFKDERDGVLEFMKVIKRMKSFDFIEFDKHDIVRSDLVKEYIISKLDLGLS
jgi:phosphate starvation-inducible protein PhoH